LQQCARLLKLADDQSHVDQLLAGFELAYAGRSVTGLPSELAKALMDSGRSSLSLKVRLGETAAANESIALLKNSDAEVSERVAIARLLGEVRIVAGIDPLLDVAVSGEDALLQRAAMTAVSAFDDPTIAQHLLKHFSSFSEHVRPAFFDLMLSRIERTRSLVKAISSGQIAPAAIPGDVVGQLRHYPDPPLADAAKRLFGAGDLRDTDRVKHRIAHLREILSEGTGSPYAGEALFMQRCAACHKLFHKGGNVGPDLTPYQRGNLDTLLTSVIDPSAEIREGFENTVLITTDGRILTGFVTDQDTQIVTLRAKSGEDIRVERGEVETIAPVGRSLMPDGLLNDLADQQLRDFFAYLRISQPISR